MHDKLEINWAASSHKSSKLSELHTEATNLSSIGQPNYLPAVVGYWRYVVFVQTIPTYVNWAALRSLRLLKGTTVLEVRLRQTVDKYNDNALLCFEDRVPKIN